MTLRLTQAGIALLMLLIPTLSWAQSNPLAPLNGTWSGRGTITLANGSRERISCVVRYGVPGGPSFTLALKCASDSYAFDFRADGMYGDGGIRGTWDEFTTHASGTFGGTADRTRISARAEGPAFSALFGMNTHGNRQTILISSPGSTMSEVTMVLSRR